MHHEIRSGDRAAHGAAVGHVRALELSARRGDAPSGGGIDVDPDDVVAFGDEPAAHRGADESGSTCHSDRGHRR